MKDDVAADACAVLHVIVLVEEPSSGPSPARSGPAQVATQAYRDNWTTIFGKKQNVGLA